MLDNASLYPNREQLNQLVLDGFQPVKQVGKNRVTEKLAKLRQLHNALNGQLTTYPAQRPSIHSPQDAFDILRCFLGSLDHEELWILNLDTRHSLPHLVKLYQGSVNSSYVRVAEVFRAAIVDNSPAILVAHNHPSGDASPSPEDVAVTRSIVQAGKLQDVDILDHLVITQSGYVSLKKRGLGFN